MEPFVHLSEYPFVICKRCEYACVADEVWTHLRKEHGHITATERRRIITLVKEIPGIIRDQAGLRTFQFPPPTTKPIPFIEAPKNDGIRCNECGVIGRTIRGIQQHCREEHGWVNDWKPGGNVVKRANQERQLPWTTGVHCQRFFRSRAASQWFEVGRDSQVAGVAAPVEDTVEQRITRIHNAQAKRFEEKQQQIIKAGDDKAEPNPWLRRVGWVEHLQGLDKARLRESVGPVKEDEAVLQRMCDGLERVLTQAQAVVAGMPRGHAVLFEVNRKSADIKPNKPFDSRMEDDSWARYKEVFRKLLCFVQRTQEWKDKDRPPYEFTEEQGDLFDEFEETAEQSGSEVDMAKGDRLCLDTMVAFFNHQYNHTHYENAIISGLAVMGIREDGGWEKAENYTPIYSAVIKVARMLVVYQAVMEQQDEIEHLQKKKGMRKDEARAAATGLFKIVRGKVQRFMTLTTHRTGPTPMDWIFESRTYGMRIHFTTTATPVIDWIGERISYQRIRFTMSELSDMLHGLYEQMRTVMGQLLMVEDDNFTVVPQVPWEKVEDDHSEDKVRYSFLQDDRNPWVANGKGWILKQIFRTKARQEEWISSSNDDTIPYRMTAIRQYGQMVERFREGMLIMMHMLGGMPARSWEILEIRHSNTEYGGVRNVIIDRGMVCFVTSYHKNYRSSDQVKIIHRYLPREVGELVVWYLWLVLPFWQEVEGIIKGADEPSAFLWADEIVKRDASEDKDAGEGEDEDKDVIKAGGERWIQERKWTSDRMRRILQEYSGQHFNAPMGISAWRHIAIGISNRYLNKAFGADDKVDEDEPFDEDDEDTLDNVWDLQAGHSTHVAGMIYARELQQGTSGIAAKRDGFRRVSRQWHRFLGFGLQEKGVMVGEKRKVDVFEGIREEARYRRFRRLRMVDIKAQLRMMMNNPSAQFRGIQKRVIETIIKDMSPIVQVTGTGGGKSLSFMLPAFCSPEGTTVVVVPLVALQGDLNERCQASGIDTHVWQSRESNRAASIVFVTPESAVTKGFQSFINRLQARGQLDRVVVDECHTVLDSDHGFRPQLRELGGVLRGLGVQTICLTATLGPEDVNEFCRHMRFEKQRVYLFRARTIRTNIAYRVRILDRASEEEQDKEIQRVVRSGLQRYSSGKIMVYGGQIERVERLGELMGCQVYHSKVDTKEGKAERVRAWQTGGQGSGQDSGRIIVTTNALGMGIDIPDIRMVVHAGGPRRLRDYAQESGRAGRDGQKSEAIIIHGIQKHEGGRRGPGQGQRMRQKSMQEKGAGSQEEEGGFDQGMLAYMEVGQCRRVVLDRVMDGEDRLECLDNEVACDVCQEARGVGPEGLGTQEEGLVVGEEEDTIIVEEREGDISIGVDSKSEDEDDDGSEDEGSNDGDMSTGAESNSEEVIEGYSGESEGEDEDDEDDIGIPKAVKKEINREENIGDGEVQDFIQARIERVREMGQEAKERREMYKEVADFREQLASWVGCCVVCRFSGAGKEDWYHTKEECERRMSEEWVAIEVEMQTVSREIFNKRRMERFAGCFHCGVPQALCDRWREEGIDGGRFKQVKGGNCQYKGVLVRILVGSMGHNPEAGIEVVDQLMQKDGFDGTDTNKWYEWFGKMIRWGGIQASQLCRMCLYLGKLENGQ